MVLHPDAAPVLWMVASSYSVYYTYQVAIPVVFHDIYGFNELETGLAFLPGLAGMTLGGIAAGRLQDWNFAITARQHGIAIDSPRARELRDFPLERARYRRVWGFIAVETALVLGYGWVVQTPAHPAVPLILQFLACGVATLLSHTASTLLVDIIPATASTAYASGQIVRCSLSAVSAAVIEPLIAAVGRGWYFTMFGLFVGITGVAAVLISRTKGRQWRQRRQAKAAGHAMAVDGAAAHVVAKS